MYVGSLAGVSNRQDDHRALHSSRSLLLAVTSALTAVNQFVVLCCIFSRLKSSYVVILCSTTVTFQSHSCDFLHIHCLPYVYVCYLLMYLVAVRVYTVRCLRLIRSQNCFNLYVVTKQTACSF